MNHVDLPRRRAGEPPALEHDAARAQLLADVDRWLASLAECLDAHVGVLSEVEDAFPAARRVAAELSADELRVRRGERAYRAGILELASVAVTLRRGTEAALGPWRPGAPARRPDDVRDALPPRRRGTCTARLGHLMARAQRWVGRA